MDSFDFDAWRELARRDPEAFYRARRQAIEDFIESHPQAADRLRALQAQIDGLRAIAGSPMQALRGISGMIDDRLEALAGHLHQLREETDRLREQLDRGD